MQTPTTSLYGSSIGKTLCKMIYCCKPVFLSVNLYADYLYRPPPLARYRVAVPLGTGWLYRSVQGGCTVRYRVAVLLGTRWLYRSVQGGCTKRGHHLIPIVKAPLTTNNG
jgi:hypothetical protein